MSNTPPRESDLKEFPRAHNQTWQWKDLRFKNSFLLLYIHALGLYGAVQLFRSSWSLILYATFLWFLSGLGVTAGAHRLWAHKTYSARWPLRLFLVFAFTMAGEGSVCHWSRDHRLHHKHSDHVADPHNASRGLFFSHVGWLILKKPKEVIETGRRIDLSDLKADPILRFQNRFYTPLSLLFSYVLPTLLGGYLFNDYWNSFWVASAFRHLFVLHATWCVNSLAHFFGDRPYTSANYGPAENLFVSLLTHGEGWHCFHHKYPFDFRAAEYCWSTWNPTAWFITTCSWLGLAYDLKQVDEKAKENSKKLSQKKKQQAEIITQGIEQMKSLVEIKTTEFQKQLEEKKNEMKQTIESLRCEMAKKFDYGAESFETFQKSLEQKFNSLRSQMESFDNISVY